MTIQEYRNHVNDKKSIDCFGMEFRLFGNDIVRIRSKNTNYELDYEKFIDVEHNYNLKEVLDLEVTDIIIRKHNELPHIVVLILDTNKKEIKEDTSTISAGMKFV